MAKNNNFMNVSSLARKDIISSNETSCLWKNILTAKRNAQQNNLLLLSGLATKGLIQKLTLPDCKENLAISTAVFTFAAIQRYLKNR